MSDGRPRVVIIGAGFGGLNCAKALRGAPVHVTVIDRSNHHLFQPLLYQVATATLSPADIATPIRSLLKEAENTEVLMAEVSGVLPAEKQVVTQDRKIPFDFLVIATGATHGYFGRNEWEKFAPGLKSLTDATAIRQKILTAFELAEMEEDAEVRATLMHFVIVGGGPTGVEMAGAIAELAHRALARDFRRINPRTAKISLVEAGPRLLPTFPDKLSALAARSLEKLGVQVLVNTRVENITEQGIWTGGRLIPSRTVVWAAGVVASPVGKWLGVETDRVGRVKVTSGLTLPGHENIFVIGDVAHALGADGNPLPGVAPVAMQQGRYVGRTIRGRLGREQTPAGNFVYKDKGNLATIGRYRAVAAVGQLQLSGLVAWVAWLVVHIYYLVGFRNRVLVFMEWAWSFFTFQRGARLIMPRLLTFL